MSKIKLFLENFLVYGLGGIISKIIPLIMVPIVTRLMPDSSYYGINDMTNTLTNFCMQLCIIGMYDAMYRHFFEKDDENYKKIICSTTFIFTCVLSVFVFVLMLIFKNRLSLWFYKDGKLSFLIYFAALSTLIGGTNIIVSAPTRMQNKRKIFLVMNTIGPVLSYSISIPLLLSGYYLIALPLAALTSGIINELVFWILNKNWFSFKLFSKKHLSQLLKIAVPLFPNFLIYWIFNSTDKIMITNSLGTYATGLYSVGSKLGLASQLIYTAFAGGWQYFAFSTMREEDQVGSNSKIFEYLGAISFICTFFICIIARPFYILLFKEEYVSSYIVAPYLFLAPLLQMLFQVAANQFLVVKKTWPNMFILLSGAIVNVVLNLVLIPKLGIEGAAISTLIGYVVADIVCIFVLSAIKLMRVSWSLFFSSLIMVLFFIIWRFITLKSFQYSLFIAVLCTILISLIYRTQLKMLVCKKKNN